MVNSCSIGVLNFKFFAWGNVKQWAHDHSASLNTISSSIYIIQRLRWYWTVSPIMCKVSHIWWISDSVSSKFNSSFASLIQVSLMDSPILRWPPKNDHSSPYLLIPFLDWSRKCSEGVSNTHATTNFSSITKYMLTKTNADK